MINNYQQIPNYRKVIDSSQINKIHMIMKEKKVYENKNFKNNWMNYQSFFLN